MSTKKNNYLITVVPLVKIPFLRNQSFFYSHSKNLKEGTLVKISFGKRNLKGIVLKSQKDFPRRGNLHIKQIKEVEEENFLSTEQIKLAKKVAEYYLVSLGLILKTIVPSRTKERKNLSQKIKTLSPNKLLLNNSQLKTAKKILNSKNQLPFLLFAPASSGKTNLYIYLIQKFIQKNKQILILVPELTILTQDKERYQKYFPQEEIGILHGKISKGKIFSFWQKIKQGKIKIILGTRQAVWAPFKKLGLIIIDEEQDISFKQWDMNPRYDARQVALILSKIYKAKVVLGSATPRIEDYYLTQKKFYQLITLPKLRKKKTETIIVDMRKEYYQKGKKQKTISVFSQTLKDEISYYLKQKQQIMLLINRQGMSAFSVCNNCGSVLRCPRCERALVYQKEGNYQCLHCNYQTDIFPVCSQCQGVNFHNYGIGTQKIEKEIKKIFPSAKIKRVDNQTMKSSIKSQEELWKDFSQKKVDILIGTQMITKAWDLSSIGLIGIIDTDSLFDWPDFFTNERAFSFISQAKGRLNRLGNQISGKIILQTFHPEEEILKWIKEDNYLKFYKEEIEDRQKLFFPPFSQIIKLVYQNKIPQKVNEKTEKIYQQLKKNLAEKEKETFRLIPPFDPLVSKIRGRWRKQIILQIPKNEKIPFFWKKIISSLDSAWIVDVDPVNLS